MKKWKRKKWIGGFLCVMCLCTAIPTNAKDEQVQLSDKEYLVSLQDSNPIFINNDKAVSGQIGSKVFLTYTVDSVTSDETLQHGVIGTQDNTQAYPYVENGTMCYTDEHVLLEEGYTYVCKFEHTEEGFSYEVAKLKGEKATPIYFTMTASDGANADYTHYGVWFAGGEGVTAVLNHVRCYDEKGTDLGIHFNTSTGVIQSDINQLISEHLIVDTSYSFTLEEAHTVAISNKYPTDSEVIYMEYEVADVQTDHTYHQGVIATRSPLSSYPYDAGNGLMLFKVYEDDEKNNKGEEQLLLKEGAKYFICFVRKAETYEVFMQRTYKGKTEMLAFPTQTGTYVSDFSHVCLWLGEGPKHDFSASFKNFKIYDEEGRSLGVQLKDASVRLTYKGELDDYSASKAVYYCQENNRLLVLKDDKKAIISQGNVEENGSYFIQNHDELYVSIDGAKEIFAYNAMLIKDEKDNSYVRLQDSKVTFETGDEVSVVDVNASTGYRVKEPAEPTADGNTFKGWCLADGTVFDFETVITESITLYAKWQDGEGVEYLAVDGMHSPTNWMQVLPIVMAILILIGCGSGCMIMMKRRKKVDEV